MVVEGCGGTERGLARPAFGELLVGRQCPNLILEVHTEAMDDEVTLSRCGIRTERARDGADGCMLGGDMDVHGALLKEGFCAMGTSMPIFLEVCFHVVVHGGL